MVGAGGILGYLAQVVLSDEPPHRTAETLDARSDLPLRLLRRASVSPHRLGMVLLVALVAVVPVLAFAGLGRADGDVVTTAHSATGDAESDDGAGLPTGAGGSGPHGLEGPVGSASGGRDRLLAPPIETIDSTPGPSGAGPDDQGAPTPAAMERGASSTPAGSSPTTTIGSAAPGATTPAPTTAPASPTTTAAAAPDATTAPTSAEASPTSPPPVVETTDDGGANRPPTLGVPAARETPWGEGVVLAVRADDPDDDPLGYAAVNLPPGLRIDHGSGVITGTPSDSGTWVVEVVATDGRGGRVGVTFDWTVTASTATDSCSLEGRVRSRRSMEPVSFRFTNGADADVALHWLNHSGNRVAMFTVDSGAAVEVQSFRTHPWVVVDPATGACLEVLDGITDGEEFTVGGDV